jgi:hypothetical protein
MSTESQESGLWLWHGEAPPSPSSSPPASRVRQILGRAVSAGRWGGWLALPGGLILGLLATSLLLSTPPDDLARADKPAVAVQPAPSPIVAPPLVPAPPGSLAGVQLDQVERPTAPTAQTVAGGTGRQVAKWRAHLTSSATGRKIHASFARRASRVFEPMTWHGGGY